MGKQGFFLKNFYEPNCIATIERLLRRTLQLPKLDSARDESLSFITFNQILTFATLASEQR